MIDGSFETKNENLKKNQNFGLNFEEKTLYENNLKTLSLMKPSE